MEEKKRIIGYSGISFLSALFTLIALAYPLIKVQAKFGSIKIAEISENGFDLIRFYSNIFQYDWAVTLIGVLCVFQLIASIACLLIIAYAFIKQDLKLVKLFATISLVVCFVFNLTYMIEGLVIVSTYSSGCYTLTYIALIVNLVIDIGYFLFDYYIKNKI